jgi:hypothetical protein
MTTTDYRYYTDRMEVTVPEGEVDGLRVERFEVTGLEGWNLRAMIREDRGCDPGTYTRLVGRKNDVMWMSDTTAERNDHKEPVAYIQLGKAKTVLINGLGLGMVLAAALTYGHVERVDVVELDERVIKLVGPHYASDPRVNIIHADAYEQINAWPRGSRWDVAWSDVWPELSADNIPSMDVLHQYYRRRTQWHGCWGRKICLGLRRELRAYGLE